MTAHDIRHPFASVPDHWVVRKLWTVAERRQEVGAEHAELLSVYLGRGVIRQSEGNLGVHAASSDRSSYQRVRPGDFVLNNQQAFRGSVGVSELDGIVSPAYLVFRLSGDLLTRRFAAHLLASPPMVGQYEQASRGVGTIQRQLHPDSLRQVQLPVPPADEQNAIAGILDEVTADLDELVAKKRRMIKLIREQHKAEIRELTRRGVDRSAPRRDSGLAWVGEIPTHWDVVPNRHVLKPRQDKVGANHAQAELLSLTTNGVVVRDTSDNSGKFPASFETYQWVAPDEMVFCLFDMAETPRTVGLSRNSGMVTGAYTVFQVAGASPRYLNYLYTGFDDEKSLSLWYTGLRNAIRPEAFLSIRCPLPPLKEQEAIADILDESAKRTVGVVERLRSQIELLQERRVALVTAAVMGELDMSAVAA